MNLRLPLARHGEDRPKTRRVSLGTHNAVDPGVVSRLCGCREHFSPTAPAWDAGRRLPGALPFHRANCGFSSGPGMISI